MNEKKPSMLDAFIQQTYGSYENANKADEIAKEREQAIADLKVSIEKKAIEQLMKTPEVRSAMAIPTRLKDGQLDYKTEVHPNFKNYDHSCEKIIHSFPQAKGLNTGDVGDMMDGMFDGSNDVT